MGRIEDYRQKLRIDHEWVPLPLMESDEDREHLLRGIRSWIKGGALEKRAVAAGRCESTDPDIRWIV